MLLFEQCKYSFDLFIGKKSYVSQPDARQRKEILIWVNWANTFKKGITELN